MPAAVRQAGSNRSLSTGSTTLAAPSSCLSRGACGRTGHAGRPAGKSERRSVAGHCRWSYRAHRSRVNARSVRRTHRRASCCCDRRATAPCLLGRTWGYDQGSVWVSDGCSAEFGTGPAVEPETTKPKPLSHIPNVGFLLFSGDEGRDLFPAFQLRAISEPAEPGPDLRRCLRQREDHAAATGHPAAEILRAVLGLVPHAEDALLPLRLVVEPLARRSGAGRGRGQPDLELQPVRERGRRHHVAARPCEARRVSSRTGSAWTIASLPTSSFAGRTPPASGSKASSIPRSSTWRCSPTT